MDLIPYPARFFESLKWACVFILQVKTLSFDQSGTYLAVGGSEVQ